MIRQVDKDRGFVFTGKHMLFAMISFFGVIIVVNITMAVLASGSWTGLVVKNSYVASQKFNAELVRAKEQRLTGFNSEISYDGGLLTFSLKDRDGEALSVSQLHAEIGRPAFEQADRVIPLMPVAVGQYGTSVDLQPGIWALKITGSVDATPYRRDARIFVGTDGLGRVE